MKYLALAFLAASALVACGTTETETNPATTTTGTSTATGLAQTPLISDCGGFIKQTKIDPPTPDPVTYCDAERLLWAYDAETGSLGLTDARMLLNCCGEHSVEVTLDNGTYVVAADTDPDTATMALVPGVPTELRDGDRVYVGAWTRLTVRSQSA